MFARLSRKGRTRRSARPAPRSFFRPNLDALEDRCVPARLLWTAPGSGSFGEAANWTVENSTPPVHAVPGPTDDAIVNRQGIVVTANGMFTVRSLSFTAGGTGTGFQVAGGTFAVTASSFIGELTVAQGASLRASGGTASLLYGATVAGQLVAEADATVRFGTRADLTEGAQLGGTGSFLVAGGFGSVVNVNAPITVANLSLLNGSRLAGTALLTVTNRLDWVNGFMQGTGTTEIALAATLHLSTPANHFLDRPLNNRGTVQMACNVLGGAGRVQNSGTWDIQADGVLAGDSFRNTGTLIKSDGTRGAIINAILENEGVIQVRAGALEVNRGGTNRGIITLAGGTLHVTTGTFALQAGTALTGTGLVRVGGRTGAAALQIAADVSLLNLTLEANGFVTGAGALTVTGLLDWGGGGMSGTGVTRIDRDAVWYMNNPPQRTLSRNFELAGYAVWFEGDLTLGNNATLTVQPTGYLDLQHFANYSLGGHGTLSNAGVVFKGGPSRTSLGPDVQLTNNGGYLGIYDGALEMTRAYVQSDGITDMVTGVTLRAAGGVDLRGGFLLGAGTIVGDVTNSGWIEVGGFGDRGTLRIEGAYQQMAGAGLGLELGGLVPGNEHDRLEVTGLTRLDGFLLVSLVPGYTPNPGATFDVLGWASRQGEFAWIGLPTGMTASYQTTGMMLTQSPT